ncbi:MAG: OmpH family outer membrane protein [Bacteroides sp.]|nr:OmpH family outer membrane protein [Bacteroides sp.]MCM1414252.1 OmpH family outer membrane protein [Bacteroides sp.]MCM1471213.1 OmpH family outer membrane protein [Bacteroides sp.]
MKKISFYVAQVCIIAAASMITCSCGGDAQKNDKNAPKTTAAKKGDVKVVSDTVSTPVPGNLNIRYIDEEKLFEKYSLAKDFQESITRLQSKLISAQESRTKDIQQLGAEIESKMKNNGYTSESEYNADMAKFNKKQQDAQSFLANLQRSTELEVNTLQTQLQDSIKSYLKTFSLENGYDAVLLQSASLYFNPAYDVTDQVVEGLNARYNKVQK